jgi:hypothetical protein
MLHSVRFRLKPAHAAEILTGERFRQPNISKQSTMTRPKRLGTHAFLKNNPAADIFYFPLPEFRSVAGWQEA